MAFIENTDDFQEVNHKDENKTNNRVDNLEWCTHMYNSHYGNNAPAKQMRRDVIKKACEATSKIVIKIAKNGTILQEFSSAREASEMTGIGRSNIQKCCSTRAKNKTAGGFQWKYKEGK